MPQRLKRRRVMRQRRGRGLEVARRQHPQRPQPAQPGLIIGALRLDQAEAAQHPPGRPRRPSPPGLGRFERDPRIHQRHRNPHMLRRQQPVRPKLGFSENRNCGVPPRQKPRHPGQHVNRRIAMLHPVAQMRRHALHGQFGRGDRAGGEQEMRFRQPLGQRLNQRQQRKPLAHAGAMQPDQRAGRPIGVAAIALLEPVQFLLATAGAPFQPEGDEGGGGGGGEMPQQAHSGAIPRARSAASTISLSAASMLGSAASAPSRGTRMGAPTHTTPRPKGRGSIILSQLFSRI